MVQAVTFVIDGTRVGDRDPAEARAALAGLFQVSESELRPLFDGQRPVVLTDVPADIAANTHRRLLHCGLRGRVVIGDTQGADVICPGCSVRHGGPPSCPLCGETTPGEAQPGGRVDTEQMDRVRRYRQIRLGLHYGTLLFAATLFLMEALSFLNERMRQTMLRDAPLEFGPWIYLPALAVLGYGIFHLLKAKGYAGWWSFLAVLGPLGLGVSLLLSQRSAGGTSVTDIRMERFQPGARAVLVAGACVAVALWWLGAGISGALEVDSLRSRSAAIVEAAGRPPGQIVELPQLERDLWDVRDDLAAALAGGGLGSSQTYEAVDGFYAAAAAVIMAHARRAYDARKDTGLTLGPEEGDSLRRTSERIWVEANRGLPEPRTAGQSFRFAHRDWARGYTRYQSPDLAARQFGNRLFDYLLTYRRAVVSRRARQADPDDSYRLEVPIPDAPSGLEAEEVSGLLTLRFGAEAPARYRGERLEYALFRWQRPARAPYDTDEDGFEERLLFVRVGGTLPDKYLSDFLKAVDAPVPQPRG